MKRIVNRIIEIFLFLVVISLISMLVILNKTGIDSHKIVPVCGYAPEFVDEIIYSEEYKNADVDERMNLFYDFLTNISENGLRENSNSKSYYELIIDMDDVFIDRNNQTITFCEQCGGDYYDDYGEYYKVWFRFEFAEDLLIKCNVDEELYFYVLSDQYREADLNTQMNMMYDKLNSMQIGVSERTNDYVEEGSISLDIINQTISYKVVETWEYDTGSGEYTDSYTNTYNFETGEFSTHEYMPRWDNYSVYRVQE